MASLYETLGVASDATYEQISQAYKSRLEMMENHGDISNVTSVNLFAIKEAYGILSSPDRRKVYDRKMANRNTPVTNEIATPAKTTLYEILGVARDATPEQISHAYKSRLEMLENQGDLSNGTSTNLFAIKEAHVVLSSPDRRRAYDQTLANGSTSKYSEIIEPRPTASWLTIAIITLIFLAISVYFFKNHEKTIRTKQAEYEAMNAKAESKTIQEQEVRKDLSITTQEDVDQAVSKGPNKSNAPILAVIDSFEVVKVDKHSATIKVNYSYAPSLTKQFIGGTASSSNGLIAASTSGRGDTGNESVRASIPSAITPVQDQDILVYVPRPSSLSEVTTDLLNIHLYMLTVNGERLYFKKTFNWIHEWPDLVEVARKSGTDSQMAQAYARRMAQGDFAGALAFATTDQEKKRAQDMLAWQETKCRNIKIDMDMKAAKAAAMDPIKRPLYQPEADAAAERWRAAGCR